jgi:hypothetical protein
MMKLGYELSDNLSPFLTEQHVIESESVGASGELVKQYLLEIVLGVDVHLNFKWNLIIR